jgi:hypothetical protein
MAASVDRSKRMMLAPYRGHDLPPDRTTRLGAWRSADALTERALFPFTLARSAWNLDQILLSKPE